MHVMPHAEPPYAAPTLDFEHARIERVPDAGTELDDIGEAPYELVIPGGLTPGWSERSIEKAFGPRDGGRPAIEPFCAFTLAIEEPDMPGNQSPFELRLRFLRRDAGELDGGQVRREITELFAAASAAAEQLHQDDDDFRSTFADEWADAQE